MAETAEKTTFPNRTQIPNIVDDLGLDPYERALYVHYKRVCGENPGAYCYEATKTTAQKTKMSTGQVSMARKSLGLRGLISIQAETRPVVVMVVNIWELNTKFYLLENRPEIDGWDVEQIKRWLYDMSTDVHTVNLSSHNDSNTRSLDEPKLTEQVKDVHHMNVNNNGLSDVHTVKQRSKESLILESSHIKLDSKRESLSRARAQDKFLGDHKGLAKKLIYICGYAGPQYVVNGKLKECTEACRQLAEWEATLDLLDEFQTDYWWGDSPPTFKQVVEYWGKFLEQRVKPKVTKLKGHQKNAEPAKDHRPDFEKRNGSGYTPEEWAKLSRGESLERH